MYKGMLGVQNVAIKFVNIPNPSHQKRFVQEIATLRACHSRKVQTPKYVHPSKLQRQRGEKGGPMKASLYHRTNLTEVAGCL